MIIAKPQSLGLLVAATMVMTMFASINTVQGITYSYEITLDHIYGKESHDSWPWRVYGEFYVRVRVASTYWENSETHDIKVPGHYYGNEYLDTWTFTSSSVYIELQLWEVDGGQDDFLAEEDGYFSQTGELRVDDSDGCWARIDIVFTVNP